MITVEIMQEQIHVGVMLKCLTPCDQDCLRLAVIEKILPKNANGISVSKIIEH
jgi:hypothetical protein